MNRWRDEPGGTTSLLRSDEPAPEQILRQLADAIADLRKATAGVVAATDRLEQAGKPHRSVPRRALELGVGVLVADGVLSLLATTSSVAAAALGLLQTALGITLGMGPASLAIDGLLLAGVSVYRAGRTGTLPDWVLTSERLLAAARAWCERFLAARRQPAGPDVGPVQPSPPPGPPKPAAPSSVAPGPPVPSHRSEAAPSTRQGPTPPPQATGAAAARRAGGPAEPLQL